MKSLLVSDQIRYISLPGKHVRTRLFSSFLVSFSKCSDGDQTTKSL